MVRLMIGVTQRDIDDARDDDETPACRCPVARAITRALRRNLDDHTVAVHRSYAQVDSANYGLPAKARAFVREFDDDEDGDPQPFTFEMVLPAPSPAEAP